MPDLGEWRPLYPAHAIEQVNARVLFAQSVTDIPWNQIQSRAREISRKLQLVTEQQIQRINVVMSNDSQGAVSPPSEIGIEFVRLERPNFYSDKLAIERNNILFESFRYTRWKSFENKLRESLIHLLDIYLSSVPVLGIQVEYIDRFNSTLSGEQTDCSKVIRDQSEFIAKGAFKKNEAWHCHVGFFTKADDATKRLANLDVDVADVSQANTTVRTIRIRTHLKDLFNQRGYEEMPHEKITPEFVAGRINLLHLELKEQLASVITEDAAKAISLNGDENA